MSNEDEDDAAPWDLLTGALGALEDIEDDGSPLNVVERHDEEDASGVHKTPLDQAGNLLKLRKWTAGLLDASLNKNDFLNNIRPLYRSLENGMKLFQTEALQHKVAESSPEEQKMFEAAKASIYVLHEGLTRMSQYKESDDPEDVKAGMQIVEDGMIELDRVQDDAIDHIQKNQ